MNYSIKAHIIREDTGKVLGKPLMRSAPRVGDELRLPGETYWTVTRVIWCLDETDGPDSAYVDRVNIGVKPAPESVGG